MKNYLIFENGEKIDVDRIYLHYPFSMLESEKIVFNLAKIVAEEIYLLANGSLEFKVAVNFFTQRSEKIKKIAAVIILSRKNKIKEISVEYLGSLFKNFFDYEIDIKNNAIKLNYLDRSLFISSFIKYFPNIFFLLAHSLFFKKESFKNAVVRAWVDIDEVLHSSVIKDCTVFIYPFGINLLRSFKFIRHCFSRYDSVSLMGVPYKFSSLLKAFAKKLQGSDIGVIRYEMDGMKRHIKHFSSFESVYTSDEFIPAIYVLYENLKPRVVVSNNCHGIGVYNRYINYDHMIVFNGAQKDFYELSCTNTSYEIKNGDVYSSKNLTRVKGGKQAIILIDQPYMEDYNLLYEFKMQEALLEKLNRNFSPDKFDVYIKFHPNRDQKSKLVLTKKYNNIKPVINMDGFQNQSVYFINMFSTAYYDFLPFGDVIFIKDDYFDPTKIFGESISTVSLDNLEFYLLETINN